MKSIKFKLLIFVGISVLVFSGILIRRTHSIVTSSIEDLTRQELTLALDFNLAIREYVAETIRPLMFKLVDKGTFIPETMSTSFVSRSIFEKVRKKFPNIIIKFSSANPRNPINRAGAEELSMIRYFNKNSQNTTWAGDVKIDGKQYRAIFHAMRMKTSCLRCHGNPADTPNDLIKRYGAVASFYRPLGEVVGMDTIAVPRDTVKKALFNENVHNIEFVGILILLFSVSLVVVFKFVMTDRLSRINQHLLDSRRQNEDLEIKSIEISGTDEIAVLTGSFNKLADRLNHTYAKLKKEIEERKKAQKELLENEEKYRKLFEMESDALVLVNMETGDLLDVNRAFINLYGYDKKEIPSMKHTDLSAEPDKTLDAIKNRTKFIPLRYHKKKNGTVFPVEITANIFKHQGRSVYIIAIRDITDHKIQEQQLTASLREKEVLLSEIHHFEGIDIITHTGELTENLRYLYGKEKDVHLSIEPSEVYLSMKQAIPCALILNELVTNSFKHAFVDREHGEIQISIHNINDSVIRVRVKDNGRGFPEESESKPANALGLELVKHLVAGQLKGEIQFKNDNGTDICVEFKT